MKPKTTDIIVAILQDRNLTTTQVAEYICRDSMSARSTLAALAKKGRIRQVRKGIVGIGGCAALWGKAKR